MYNNMYNNILSILSILGILKINYLNNIYLNKYY